MGLPRQAGVRTDAAPAPAALAAPLPDERGRRSCSVLRFLSLSPPLSGETQMFIPAYPPPPPAAYPRHRFLSRFRIGSVLHLR